MAGQQRSDGRAAAADVALDDAVAGDGDVDAEVRLRARLRGNVG